jgi:hypothetical protein
MDTWAVAKELQLIVKKLTLVKIFPAMVRTCFARIVQRLHLTLQMEDPVFANLDLWKV